MKGILKLGLALLLLPALMGQSECGNSEPASGGTSAAETTGALDAEPNDDAVVAAADTTVEAAPDTAIAKAIVREEFLRAAVSVADNGRPATVTLSWRQNVPVDLRVSWRYDSTAPWITSTGWTLGRDYSSRYRDEGTFSFTTNGQQCWNTDSLTVRVVLDPEGAAPPATPLEQALIIAIPFGTMSRSFDGYNSAVIRLGGPGSWPLRSGAQNIYNGSGDYWKYAQHDLIMVSWYQIVHSGQANSSFPGFVDSVRAINPDALVFGFDNTFTFYPDTNHVSYTWGNEYTRRKMFRMMPYAVPDSKGQRAVSPFKAWTGNMLNVECRAIYAEMVGWAWNHSTNRRPGVGLMMDVMEATWNFADIDADSNGITDWRDPGERHLRMQAWLDVVDRVRAATAGEVMLGGNSGLALRWPDLSAKLDFIFAENIPKHLWGKREYRYRNMLDPQYRSAGLRYFGTGPDHQPQKVYFPEILARMRSENQGPVLVIEADWAPTDRFAKPYYIDIYGLLFDDVFPLWTNSIREYDHPQHAIGLPAIDLGDPLTGIVTTEGDGRYRQFERGFVKLWLAAADNAVTPFQYVVVDSVAGDTLRAKLGAAIARSSKAPWRAERAITISGEKFGDSKGRGFIRVANSADFSGAVQRQNATSWTATEIRFSLATHDSWRDGDPLWVQVVTSTGEVAYDGWYEFKRPR